MRLTAQVPSVPWLPTACRTVVWGNSEPAIGSATSRHEGPLSPSIGSIYTDSGQSCEDISNLDFHSMYDNRIGNSPHTTWMSQAISIRDGRRLPMARLKLDLVDD